MEWFPSHPIVFHDSDTIMDSIFYTLFVHKVPVQVRSQIYTVRTHQNHPLASEEITFITQDDHNALICIGGMIATGLEDTSL
jgi:hypothetical protein